MRSKRDWACYLAQLGYWVYPMAPGTKIAVAGMMWGTMATSDMAQVDVLQQL